MIPYLGCLHARDMLEPFVDGELAVSEQVMLEAHLRWCDTCRAHVDDLRTIGSTVRVTAAATLLNRADTSAVGAMYDGVLTRIRAERDQSLAVRWREWFTDMRYLWPALGASLAVVLCAYASTFVNRFVRAERPHSMAALISVLANPGSDQNPLHLESGMLVPRALDVGPALESIQEDEAVFAVSAVLTREGRVATYELLQSVREQPGKGVGTASSDATAVFDAVRHSRFEPAQTAEGVVAVNMVWVMARTTVKGSAKADGFSNPAVSGGPAAREPTTLRPARS